MMLVIHALNLCPGTLFYHTKEIKRHGNCKLFSFHFCFIDNLVQKKSMSIGY